MILEYRNDDWCLRFLLITIKYQVTIFLKLECFLYSLNYMTKTLWIKSFLFISFFSCLIIYPSTVFSTTTEDSHALTKNIPNTMEKINTLTNNKNISDQVTFSLNLKQVHDEPNTIKVVRFIPSNNHYDLISITAITEDISKCKSIKLFKGDEEKGEILGNYIKLSTSNFKVGDIFSVKYIFNKGKQNKTIKLTFSSNNGNIFVNGKRNNEIIINTSSSLLNNYLVYFRNRGIYTTSCTCAVILSTFISFYYFYYWPRSFSKGRKDRKKFLKNIYVKPRLRLRITVQYILPASIIFVILCNLNYFLS